MRRQGLILKWGGGGGGGANTTDFGLSGGPSHTSGRSGEPGCAFAQTCQSLL